MKIKIKNKEVFFGEERYGEGDYIAKGIIVKKDEIVPFEVYEEFIKYISHSGSSDSSWCLCETSRRNVQFALRGRLASDSVSKFIDGKISWEEVKENKDKSIYSSSDCIGGKLIRNTFSGKIMVPDIQICNVDKRLDYEYRPNTFKKNKKDPDEILDRKEFKVTVKGYMIFRYITNKSYFILNFDMGMGNTYKWCKFPVKVK